MIILQIAVKTRLTSSDKSDTARCERCGKSNGGKRLRKQPYCSNQCSKEAAKSSISPPTTTTPTITTTTNGPSTPTSDGNNDDKKKIKAEPAVTTVEPPAPSPTSTTAPTVATPNASKSPSTVPTTTTTTPSSATKRPNSQTNGIGSPDAKKSAVETSNGVVSAVAASSPTAAPAQEQESFMVRWTVKDVSDFIRDHSGYPDYAEDFQSQDIDGQALVLLNETHLVNTMGLKLGPALKIISKIEAMKASGPPMDQQ